MEIQYQNLIGTSFCVFECTETAPLLFVKNQIFQLLYQQR